MFGLQCIKCVLDLCIMVLPRKNMKDRRSTYFALVQRNVCVKLIDQQPVLG